MRSLGQISKRASQLVADNSPVILTAIGVTGAVVTAYLTGKASFKAAQILAEESPYLETKEKVQKVWKLYIPAATTGVLTVTSIILANRIEHRRSAAMAAAFVLSERTFEEYKSKVVEKLGARKEQNVRDEIAQDRVLQNPPPPTIVIATGKVLCYDGFAGRYFESDMESLKKAQNDINRQIMYDGFASLSDFYDLLGLRHTDLSDDVGWNSETQEVSLKFSSVLTEDNRPCLAFTFEVHPFRGHSLLH